MRFLLDMNLPPGLAQWLAQLGHDAVHAIDAGYAAFADSEILARAAADQRIVISFDLDFGDIAAAVGSLDTGMVLLRLRLAGQAHVRRRLQVAIDQAGPAMQDGAIVLVEDTRIRIRHMPPSVA